MEFRFKNICFNCPLTIISLLIEIKFINKQAYQFNEIQSKIIKKLMQQSSVETLPKNRGKISLARMKYCKNCQKHKQQLTSLRRQVFILTKKLQQSQKKNSEIMVLCEQIQKTKQKLIRKMVNRSQSFYLIAGNQMNHIKKEDQRKAQNMEGRKKIKSHMDQSWMPGSRLNETVHYIR